MQSKNRGWIILALFFGSGATALVYEVVWSKFLAVMFGSTVYAQTVVLAVFMGGLALGNRLFGAWADGLRRPVRAYGTLEVLVGIYSLLFPALDRMINHIFVVLGTPIAERSGLLLALKGVLSAVLLIGPTFLMGGTLPLLAAWLHKSSEEAGRRSARFYSVNSLGAVVGAAFAGFFLVQKFGMVATLQISAAVNLIIGFTAILLGGKELPEPVRIPPAPATGVEAAAPGTLRWAGLIVALTGGISMGLELLASRSLVLIFGSSLQSFAIVLMAFILGIGLGSAWIASARRSGKSCERWIVLLLCIAATWVAVLVFNMEQWVNLYRWTRLGLARNDVGYMYHLLLNSGISLVILGVPAGCIGAVLPLMIRVLSHDETGLGKTVGQLVTWNTLGAVAGTLITGFVIMPAVGLRNAFGIVALLLAVVALFIAWRRSWWIGTVLPFAAAALSICVFCVGGEGWRQIMSSGIFRIRETTFIHGLMANREKMTHLVFYEDAPDATVSVETAGGIITPHSMGLRINGKADAGTDIDVCNQLLLAHLPLLAKPDARDVFVLGLGSGMTAGAVLDYPVNRVVVGENCQPVIQAAKLFQDWNNHVVTNPRAQIHCEDARTVLTLSPDKYDVIITEPSNPWTIGVGSVFNQDFYKLAASRLKPGGIIAQWFHLYETEDGIVDLVLRTFTSVFPDVEIWDTGGGDMVILGSLQPWKTGPAVFRKGFSIPRVASDLEMIDILSPEQLMARQLASQQTGFAIAGKGPIQSDLYPILEYSAPKALYLGDRSRMLDHYDERTRQELLAPAGKTALLHSLPLANSQIVFGSFSTINGELYGCLFGNPSSANVPCAFQTPTDHPEPGANATPLDQAEKAFAAGNLDQASEFAALATKENPDDAQAAYVSRVIARARQSDRSASRTVAVR